MQLLRGTDFTLSLFPPLRAPPPTIGPICPPWFPFTSTDSVQVLGIGWVIRRYPGIKTSQSGAHSWCPSALSGAVFLLSKAALTQISGTPTRSNIWAEEVTEGGASLIKSLEVLSHPAVSQVPERDWSTFPSELVCKMVLLSAQHSSCRWLLFVPLFLAGVRSQQAFRTQPKNVTVKAGGTAVLRCEVLRPTGVVQWVKDGLFLGPLRSLPGFPRYSMIGQEEKGQYHLRIEKVALEDDSPYECQVGQSESSRALISQVALITVLNLKYTCNSIRPRSHVHH
ncbi:hypothetical protein SKAU_G00146880 [Synaphobranchus kaupii]|uniref:Ig-like domain-containing protein n=1 Tax=Synaphobranchus kaupii TaxID=118154 RepID=A0A9Q1FTG2_SYNKA|nr:hypothetical protein SKAU_G00146880 [Synaphobranchus kaupii]